MYCTNGGHSVRLEALEPYTAFLSAISAEFQISLVHSWTLVSCSAPLTYSVSRNPSNSYIRQRIGLQCCIVASSASSCACVIGSNTIRLSSNSLYILKSVSSEKGCTTTESDPRECFEATCSQASMAAGSRSKWVDWQLLHVIEGASMPLL